MTRKTEEEIKAERQANRLAMRKLAAAPELLAATALLLLFYAVLVDGSLVAILVGTAVFALFGLVYLTNGDSLVGSLILGGVGFVYAAFLETVTDPDINSLLWLLPALGIVLTESAMTFNNFRRRRGEVSRRVPTTLWSNLVAVGGTAFGISVATRWLAGLDGRVEWPWFAGTALVLCGLWVAGLVRLRRAALPADRRRFSPGRRMIPPPT